MYVLIEGLVKRGYVSELPNKKINTYQAIDPGAILSNMKNTVKDFSEMLPVLRTLSNKKNQKPKIIYHETKEGVWNTWNEMNEAENQFYITDYERLTHLFPTAIDVWLNYAKNKKNVKHLTTDKEKNIATGRKFKEAGQKIKYLQGIKNFDVDIAVYNDKLGITLLEENPCIVTIQSKKLISALLPIFKIAWESASKV